MLTDFYRDQLPKAVTQDAMASDESLYLLTSILIYRQVYRPRTTEDIQQFILGVQAQLSWPKADFARALVEVGALMDAYEPELDAVVFLIPNVPRASA